MHHQRRRPMIVTVAALIAVSVSAAAAAQPAAPGPSARETARSPSPRIEIWGGWASTLPVDGGRLFSSYEPPLRQGGTLLESRAAQELTVDRSFGHGAEAGVNVFFSSVAGLQALWTVSSAGITGDNGDYDTLLRYISRPPPSYEPREGTLEQSAHWRPTAGALRHQSFALGTVLRWRAPGGRLGGTVSGGVSVDRVSGEIESLGYTQFIMGGHSTLFPVTHRVRVAPGENFYSPYIGGDVHVALTRRLALVGGVRVDMGSRVTTPTRVLDLVDPDENPWTPEISEVAARLDGQLLELPFMRWRTVGGVKVFLK